MWNNQAWNQKLPQPLTGRQLYSVTPAKKTKSETLKHQKS